MLSEKFIPKTYLRLRRSHGQFLPANPTVSIRWKRAGAGLTASGYAFVGSILFLVFASSRHGLNAGYLMLFCLGMILVLSSWIGLSVIAAIELSIKPALAVAAGTKAFIELEIDSKTNRNGIEIWTENEPCFEPFDLVAGTTKKIKLVLSEKTRGLYACPKIVIQTRQPLGLWRIYIFWEPPWELVVYPSPEGAPPKPRPYTSAASTATKLIKIPAAATVSNVARTEPNRRMERKEREESENNGGLKPYQNGESQRTIAWRVFAKSDGAVLASRDTSESGANDVCVLTLEDAMKAGNFELALSRLTAWCLQLNAKNQSFKLSLESVSIGPGLGNAHLSACLKALALSPTLCHEGNKGNKGNEGLTKG